MTKNDVKSKNFKININQYLIYWWIFLIFIATAIVSANIYIKFQIPVYSSNATVLIKENKRGIKQNDELAIFSDLGISSGINNLQNEIELFKTSSLISEVIQRLRLNVKVFTISSYSSLKKFEIYNSQPFDIEVIGGDSSHYNKSTSFAIRILNENQIGLMEEDEVYQTVNFGSPFNLEGRDYIIHKNDSRFYGWNTKGFIIEIKSLKSAISEYKNRLSINLLRKDASILELNLKGTIIDQNNDFLNNLIQIREEKTNQDKQAVSISTSEFINNRIKIISEELSEIEMDGEHFKSSKKLINLTTDAELFKEKESEFEMRAIETSIQLRLIEYIKDFLASLEATGTLIPSNLGLEDQTINSSIEKHNTLVLERNNIASLSSSTNPRVKRIDEKIEEIRANLSESINNTISTLSIRLKALREKESFYESEVAKVPNYEREYRSILRQKEVKEALYLYLLQKREENEIASVASVSDMVRLEEASGSSIPISPKKSSIYLQFLFVGFGIPFGAIYLKNLLDNKVKTVEDITNYEIPYIGNLPISKKKEKLVHEKNSRSPISEALRILRTNMNFIMSNEGQDKGGKIIMVTSTIPGEGKSFVSINLAHSIAQTEKKTLLIGMDLRAPKLVDYLAINDNVGVSNFLANPSIQVSDLIELSPYYENLSIITSGHIPPNPSELLLKPRVEELFNELRKDFDYIIVDTAPIGMVVDTLLITKHSDLLLYVVRYNYLEKNALSIPQDFYTQGKIKNLGVLLNGVDFSKEKYGKGFGYGYGYGYGEKNKKSSWWKRKH